MNLNITSLDTIEINILPAPMGSHKVYREQAEKRRREKRKKIKKIKHFFNNRK